MRGRDGDFWFSTFFFFQRFDRKEVRGKGHAPRAPEKVGFRFCWKYVWAAVLVGVGVRARGVVCVLRRGWWR